MVTKFIRLIPVVLLSTIGLPAQIPQSIAPANAPAKILMILDITVHDTSMYEQYRKNVEPVISKYGGKYLVRSGGMAFDTGPDRKVIPVEGGWNPDRLIIVQWDSMEQLQKFATSAEYLAVADLRNKSASTKSIIVKEYMK
ncbi:MAG: DUF1330 domain-containing protein [Chitinophagaceae bacterium]|nr:DUF1330 domain-containing protein [Chitinophagaceae bacterium]MBK7123005.1 DUF1330 domain-containing protein [Chitinophagaceae bacterium]MBK7559134.1 DUF1330 domain-containing protein [Chitinophagaceae bacterium]MBK9533215.1 DUF1330 domain-containing protein [Chitinophagaceae bacterium]HQW91927.1 DUF1330 domain-containing protein [Ferruginibacter sp.]